MTIIPSFLRRSNRHRRTVTPRTFRCESLESRRLLAIDIVVGDHILLPNTPNQVIEITATNTGAPEDIISGINFIAQLGDGDKNPGDGAPEPDFQGVDFTNTVWDAVPTVPFVSLHDNLADTVLSGDTPEPSYAASGGLLGTLSVDECAVGVCDFAPDGVIARLIIDTTGFTSGTFDLNASSNDAGITDFLTSNLYEEQQIDLAGATGGQFRLQYTENSVTSTTADIAFDASAADIEQALEDLQSGNLFTQVVVTENGGPGNWTVSFQGILKKFNDLPEMVIVNGSSPLTGGGAATVTELVAGRTGGIVIPNVVDGSITIESSVVDRHVFYNGSFYDNNPGAGRDDNNSVAPDKDPLLPGGTATFANYTSYSRGINGIMIDVDKVAVPADIELSDFLFAVGNNNSPSGWNTNVPAPSITVHEGEGDNGADRIKLIWNDNDIEKTWLQVTMLANGDTGLSSNDVFYFGNAIGESGTNPANAFVTSADALDAINNPRGIFNPAPIDFDFDYNRDRFVSSADALLSINNATGLFNSLRLISVPAGFGKLPSAAGDGEGEASSFSTRDANGDGKVTIADAILIVSSLRNNSDTNDVDLTKQVVTETGLTPIALSDALAIIAEIRTNSSNSSSKEPLAGRMKDNEVDLLFSDPLKLEL